MSEGISVRMRRSAQRLIAPRSSDRIKPAFLLLRLSSRCCWSRISVEEPEEYHRRPGTQCWPGQLLAVQTGQFSLAAHYINKSQVTVDSEAGLHWPTKAECHSLSKLVRRFNLFNSSFNGSLKQQLHNVSQSRKTNRWSQRCNKYGIQYSTHIAKHSQLNNHTNVKSHYRITRESQGAFKESER